MLLREHELAARRLLTEAGVESPGLCARLLTMQAAGMDRLAYLISDDFELDSAKAEILANLVKRRCAGEPLAYILAKKEFYGRDFLVSPSTLIPRPETETLIDASLEFLRPDPLVFADFGCGSGCIGLTLLCERPDWRGLLLEASPAALEITAQNAANLDCMPDLLLADLFDAPLRKSSLDLLISNPPYVGRCELPEVAPETLAWEPHLALFSEANGLGHLRAVMEAGAFCLKPGGLLILEHGCRQREALIIILAQAGFELLVARDDLAGLPRCLIARKRGEKQNGGTERFRAD